MDRKDEIILQQMDLIRSMTERNLRSMDTDFWGTPLMEKKTNQPPISGKSEKPASQTQAAKPEEKEEIPPKEKIEDLLAELDSYVGMDAIKTEVRSLINMVQVYKLRREHDLPTTDMSLHMVFSGNPGLKNFYDTRKKEIAALDAGSLVIDIISFFVKFNDSVDKQGLDFRVDHVFKCQLEFTDTFAHVW